MGALCRLQALRQYISSRIPSCIFTQNWILSRLYHPCCISATWYWSRWLSFWSQEQSDFMQHISLYIKYMTPSKSNDLQQNKKITQQQQIKVGSNFISILAFFS